MCLKNFVTPVHSLGLDIFVQSSLTKLPPYSKFLVPISDLWICTSCSDFEKKTDLPITSPEGVASCATRAAARPAFGAPVSQWAVRDAGKSKRSSDSKCQANDCDAQAVQRGKVSRLFLCQKCRDYEKIHGFSINSVERAAHLQKKQQKVDARPKDGLCEAIHCETEHGK